MILVLTPNPSVDKTMVVPGFAPGRIFRTPPPLSLAGGKGFNFARALRTLGESSLVVGPLAGHNGQWLRALAEAEGLACDCLWVQGETRTCLTIVDPEAGRSTELYEAGSPLSAGAWDQLAARVARHLPEVQALAVCGSFLPGSPATELRDLLVQARQAGVPALVDTHGPHLAQALMARPALVKVNQQEAGDLLGEDLATPATALAALPAVRALGAQAVVITLGAQGAVGIDATGRAFGWSAPEVPSLCTVGSGDSFFAAVALGWLRRQSLQEAVRQGIAAGAANSLQVGAGLFTHEQAENLVGRVTPMDLPEAR